MQPDWSAPTVPAPAPRRPRAMEMTNLRGVVVSRKVDERTMLRPAPTAAQLADARRALSASSPAPRSSAPAFSRPLPAVVPAPSYPPPAASSDSVRAVVGDSRSHLGTSSIASGGRRSSSLASWAAGVFMFVSFAALGAAIVANGQHSGLINVGRSAASQPVALDQPTAVADEIIAPELSPLHSASPTPVRPAAAVLKGRGHKGKAPATPAAATAAATATETAPAPPPPPPAATVPPQTIGGDDVRTQQEAQRIHDLAEQELHGR